ncbi:MAG TPA: hypothetical protein PLB52_02880 [Candidatus Moranbacteria bacterium]|mgnify:CR=1 FL=1|nr:hypothetical protein [Candidatus Moranbacteria bacterium]
MNTAHNEKLQWFFTLLNTAQNLFDAFGNFTDKIPKEMKQRLPGFLGLSLEDERIFNGVMAQLLVEQQTIIGRFLYEKCKDYERNRFINVVAGMEVKPGSPAESEIKWDSKTGSKVFEKTKAETPGVDCRKVFLEKFAEIAKTDLDKAYENCVGGRMIIPDPMSQKALKAFSDSVGWFKKIVLLPFGVNSVAELTEKAKNNLANNAADITNRTQTFRERARAFRESQKRRQ